MPSAPELAAAAQALGQGELVAFPTETVYGLGADAANPLAVRRIFAAKGRPAGHPLIVHAADLARAQHWAVFDARAHALAQRFWPGPLTLILPRTDRVPDAVTGGRATVGVRVPRHPVAQALLAAHAGGIAAPSANRFGRVSPTTAQHVRQEFGDAVRVLDGGACPVGVESTIVDLSGERPALLRPGAVSRDQLVALLGPLGTSQTAAPGTLAAHYAPRTSLLLCDADQSQARARALRAQGRAVVVLPARPAEDYARMLYAELRRLDALGVDVLVAARPPPGALAEAVTDRLERAAVGSGGGRGPGPRDTASAPSEKSS